MKYDLCVIGGLGHVGLPLSIVFADRGLNVCAYDISEPTAKIVSNGNMPFLDEGAPELLPKVLKSGRLTISTSPDVISQSENIIVTIGTPTDLHLSPEPTVEEAIADISKYFVDGQLIILRSTVHPGTTEHVDRLLKSKGKKVDVAYCPERIAQGYGIKELTELPHIVSSESKSGVERATRLFKKLNDDVVVLTPQEAELSKLFTNAWRYISFAAANQFFLVANEAGVDFHKIHKAMSYKYPRLKNLPRAGFAAGPCLYKDTIHITSFANHNFHLGNAAMTVNESMPTYLIGRIKRKRNLKKSTVGILGMAFKADIDDKRDSLSYKLRKLLKYEAKAVYCTDVYIKDLDFVSPEELLKKSDVVIVGAPHKEYAALKISNRKLLVDIWNFYGRGGVI
jgi:UDP-N-acetyl-D-mannosaminuronic acid dehydrogenase